MHTVVIEGIRRCDESGFYRVDISIAGECRTFLFEVEGRRVVQHDVDYGTFTQRYPMARHLAALLLQFHGGASVQFPVDLLEYGLSKNRRERGAG
jgi:hypothetical protein